MKPIDDLIGPTETSGLGDSNNGPALTPLFIVNNVATQLDEATSR